MSMLKNLIEKKKKEGSTLSPIAAKAKSSALDDMMNDMLGRDAGKLKGLKKVTVASNSPSGLEKGLDKAKEIVGDKDLDTPGMDTADLDESAEEENAESPEMQASEDEGKETHLADTDGMSADELESHIEELKAKLEKRKQA
jgi:hypothetical protein